MMTLEIDTTMLWIIAGVVVTFIGAILKMSAEMTIKGIYKRIESCHDKLESNISDAMKAAVRANQRCDDIMSILLGQSEISNHRPTRKEEARENGK